MKKVWHVFYHGPWPYWAGALVLACLNVVILYVRHKPWGVSTNIEEWALWLGKHAGFLSSFSANDQPPLTFGSLMSFSGTYLNLGLILGAFWATLTGSQARFRPIRNKKFFFSALIGGIMMGYGARIAYGCNIGGLLNGIASSSLTGWIFAVAVFIGTWIGTKLLIRFLM